MWKKVLIGCVACLALALLAAAAILSFLARRVVETRPESVKIPSNLINPVVRFGSDFLERTTWLEDSDLDRITDIVVG